MFSFEGKFHYYRLSCLSSSIHYQCFFLRKVYDVKLIPNSMYCNFYYFTYNNRWKTVASLVGRHGSAQDSWGFPLIYVLRCLCVFSFVFWCFCEVSMLVFIYFIFCFVFLDFFQQTVRDFFSALPLGKMQNKLLSPIAYKLFYFDKIEII